MPLDKSWIDWGTRCSVPYFAKLDEFLDFAYANKDVSSSIYCPCRKCQNRLLFGRSIVREHLRINGFWKRYKIWTRHGETVDQLKEPVQMDKVLPESEGYMNVETTRLFQDAAGTTNVSRPEGESGTATIKDFNELLSDDPKDQRELATVRDKIFHSVMGADSHGYCRTYGTVVACTSAYPLDPLAPTSTPNLVQKLIKEITQKVIEEVTEKVTKEVTRNVTENITRLFDKKYEQLLARIMILESNAGQNANSLVQEATSVHQDESVGDSCSNEAIAEGVVQQENPSEEP